MYRNTWWEISVKFIDCTCNGKSPSATQYSPLLNEGQEKSSFTMKNWQWHKVLCLC